MCKISPSPSSEAEKMRLLSRYEVAFTFKLVYRVKFKAFVLCVLMSLGGCATPDIVPSPRSLVVRSGRGLLLKKIV